METKRSELINLLKETIESIEKCTDEDSKKKFFETAIESINQYTYIGMDAPIFMGDLSFLKQHFKLRMYDNAIINLDQVTVHLMHSRYLDIL